MKLMRWITFLGLGWALFSYGVPDWENPAVLQINKLAPHAEFRAYADAPSAKTMNVRRSPWYKSLNGSWKFHYVERPADRPQEFYKVSFNDSKWDTITVPSNWQRAGYGQAIYCNSIYPFPKKPPFIDHQYNPVGSYRTRFSVPAQWAGRKTILTFDGVDSAFYLWVNGQKVGYSQGSRTPASFDISPYLREKENLLAVEVYRWCDGSYLEDQDFWRLSGIFRDVYLASRPQIGIRDFRVQTQLDRAYKNAELAVSVELENSSSSAAQKTIRAQLLDASGKSVAQFSARPAPVAAQSKQSVSLSAKINNPLKWTAETPNLYQLLIQVVDAGGQVEEVIPQNVGFRAVEMIDGVLTVNGQRIVIKGANRHEHHPELGHVVTEESMLKDILLLKQGNFNAVRTCHYPNVSRWYELCARYGLYLVDEANIETHGMGWGKPHKIAKSPEWKEAHLSRVRNMFERDKNYPAIIAWSIGNESGKGANLQACYQWIKKQDSTRSVGYEQIGKGPYTDYWTPMYAAPSKIESYAKGNPKRPVILCEYTHAMGNSNGNLKEYWDLFNRYPKAQGGFVWDWMDQGLTFKDSSGKTFYGYGGDFERPGTRHDNNFCMNGILAASGKPHPGYYTLKKCQEGVYVEALDVKRGTIKITNRYSFINLYDLLNCRWRLESKGAVLAQGDYYDLDVKPQQSKTIQLNLPAVKSDGEVWLNLSFVLKADAPYAKKGFELAWAQFKVAEKSAASSAPAVALKNCRETGNAVRVTGAHFEVEISKKSGQITSYVVGGKRLLQRGPAPDFWRPLTDNDRGYRAYDVMKVWEHAPESLTIQSVDVQKTATDATVAIKGVFGSIHDSAWQVTYRIAGDGSIRVSNSFAPQGKLPKLLRVGTQLVVDPAFTHFTWYGRGPNPTYSDRKLEPIGLFSGTVDEQWVDYSRPQENGNKVDVRWAALRDERGFGLLAVADEPLSVGVKHYSHQDMKGDPTTTKYYKPPKNDNKSGSSEGVVTDMVKGGVRHTHEMQKRPEVYWNLDAVQSGVGGNNSWGQWPLPPYQLTADKTYRWSYTLKPLTPADNVWEKAR